MGATLVDLNVNPCKMCMPLGAATAFSGLKNCMTILHGSQGCATYIRRHMATHYNEPIDIASSSLTEEGTVFGGEANLIKGLKNLIALYNPDIIGIATTCLAETIGEDVNSIVKKFLDSNDTNVKIINAASPGYGGTQYEGFMKVLHAVVSQTDMETEKNDFINIITPPISPADYRLLKSLLGSMGLRYILLPDLSENLDGVHQRNYERLKSGGTSISEISKMAGARHTIELSLFIGDENSPAQYLFDEYSVPFTRMALPVGVRDTDAFLEVLSSLGGKKPESFINERGRYLDAMIDSHKYCADGRAAIFGEPDFVYSMTRLCCENGIVPLLIATGSDCPGLSAMLEDEAKKCADVQLLPTPVILDNCDFDTIEVLSKKMGVNIMIGSSDGRRAAHRLGIGLVRCAFPIHDRVGGQRVKTLLFEGSLTVLDEAANLLLARKEEGFRDEIYESFFGKEEKSKPAEAIKNIAEKTETHPCFNCSGGQYARIHLPVAPNCNIQCNYCVRKFDCPNESRPGVTTEVLSPYEALEKFKYVKEKVDNLTVVGIAGPGDALADFNKTRETLSLIRREYPEVTFCLSTNGLMLPLYAEELISLGVSHVTVTMNAADPETGAKIYKHIDFMGKRYTGIAAASILLSNQLTGISYLASRGIIVKVNTVVLKGINDHQIEEIIKTAAEAGAYISNIMQLIPVKGAAFENMELVSLKEINVIRKACSPHLKQMYHCRQCRADAVGTLDNDRSLEFGGGCGNKKAEQKKESLRYAVATKSGMLVDQHFGQAGEFYIYESDGENVSFLEKRAISKYCTGAEGCFDEKESKMELILRAVADCSGVLALRIGDSPSKKLSEMGIKIFTTYDRIEDAVKKASSN